MKKHTWLDALENASLVGLGVGSVASLLFKEILYTTTPLSLLVAFGLVNRRRFEHTQEQEHEAALADVEARLAQRVRLLQQQMVAMPTPETLHNVRKSLLRKDREVAEALYAEVKAVQQELTQRIDHLDQQNIAPVRQQVQDVGDRCTHLSEGLAQLGSRLDELPNTVRLETVAADVSELRTNVTALRGNLDNLAAHTKPSLTSLQEEVGRIDRRISSLSPSFDLTSVKQEMGELVRLIGDLVSRRELSTVLADLHNLQDQQETLRKTLESMNLSMVELRLESGVTQIQTDDADDLTATQLRSDFSNFGKAAESTPRIQDSLNLSQLNPLSARVYPELGESGSQHLDHLRSQLATIQEVTERLTQQQSHLRDQVNKLPKTLDVVALQCQVQELSKRIPSSENTELAFKSRIQEILQQELQFIDFQLQGLSNAPQSELIFDLKSPAGEAPSEETGRGLAGSRAVLELALDSTEERLVLVWPWADQCDLDDGLMRRFERFLSQGRRLDLGWCHLAERHDEQFLGKIRRSWLMQPPQNQALQETLSQLLRLKRAYPNHFQFKILGTTENFLVSDRSFAVLGITDALKTSTTFPELQLKLKTSDPEVIQRLVNAFDSPNLAAEDLTAHWNRAITRYELGDKKGAIADFNHMLKADPNDAITFSYRGLVHYDLGDAGAAIADFTRSIQRSPHQGSAYCNRGYIRYEQGDQGKAISDYSLAIQAQPELAIAYFCRGMAWQKLENYEEAATDYREAIRLQPESAVAHYYRGIVLQKLERHAEAVKHLETASREFGGQGHPTNAQKARKQLARARRLADTQPMTPPPVPVEQPEAIAKVDAVQQNPFESVTIISFPNARFPNGINPAEVAEATSASVSVSVSDITEPISTVSELDAVSSTPAPSNVIPFPTLEPSSGSMQSPVSSSWADPVPADHTMMGELERASVTSNLPPQSDILMSSSVSSQMEAAPLEAAELETLITFFQSV
jgi:tetratricopeptide (TPR) repeat protein